MFQSSTKPLRPRSATVTLPSRVDVHAIEAISAQTNNMLSNGLSAIVMDASSVKHVDQAGLDALLDMRMRVEAAGVCFDITSSTTVQVAAELTGSTLLLTTLTDLEAG
jgi:anti-anti-sigma regulatory factor